MPIKMTLMTIFALWLLAGAVTTALAGNVRWLRDSALSNMTPDDMEVLRSAARNVLDYGRDGESRRWENADTGAKGVLTPLESIEQDGEPCRRLELFNEVGSASGRSVFLFCRQKDGTWRIPAQSSGGASSGN